MIIADLSRHKASHVACSADQGSSAFVLERRLSSVGRTALAAIPVPCQRLLMAGCSGTLRRFGGTNIQRPISGDESERFNSRTVPTRDGRLSARRLPAEGPKADIAKAIQSGVNRTDTPCSSYDDSATDTGAIIPSAWNHALNFDICLIRSV